MAQDDTVQQLEETLQRYQRYLEVLRGKRDQLNFLINTVVDPSVRQMTRMLEKVRDWQSNPVADPDIAAIVADSQELSRWLIGTLPPALGSLPPRRIEPTPPPGGTITVGTAGRRRTSGTTRSGGASSTTSSGRGDKKKEFGIHGLAGRVMSTLASYQEIPANLESVLEKTFGGGVDGGPDWRNTDIVISAGTGRSQRIPLGEDLRAERSYIRYFLTQADTMLGHVLLGTVPSSTYSGPTARLRNLANQIESNCGWDFYNRAMVALGVRKDENPSEPAGNQKPTKVNGQEAPQNDEKPKEFTWHGMAGRIFNVTFSGGNVPEVFPLEEACKKTFGDNWEGHAISLPTGVSRGMGSRSLGDDLSLGDDSYLRKSVLAKADVLIGHVRVGTAPQGKKTVPSDALRQLVSQVNEGVGWDIYEDVMRQWGIRKEVEKTVA